STEEMLMQRLSPGRWAYAWRQDDAHAVVAEVQYRERRDVASEIDVAMLRLLCSAKIRAGDDDESPAAALPGPLQVWPHVERRAPARPSPVGRVAALLTLLCALIAGAAAVWLAPRASDAAREAQAHAAALARQADATMA